MVDKKEGLNLKKWSEMTDEEIKKQNEENAQKLYGSLKNEILIREQKKSDFDNLLSTYEAFRHAVKLFLCAICASVCISILANIFTSLLLINFITIPYLILIVVIATGTILIYIITVFLKISKYYNEQIERNQKMARINLSQLEKIKNPEIVKQEWKEKIKTEKINLYWQLKEKKEKELGRPLTQNEDNTISDEVHANINKKYADHNPLNPYEMS